VWLNKQSNACYTASKRIWCLTLGASTYINGVWRDLACISRCCCYTGSKPTACPFHCTNHKITDSIQLPVPKSKQVPLAERTLPCSSTKLLALNVFAHCQQNLLSAFISTDQSIKLVLHSTLIYAVSFFLWLGL